MNVLIWKTYLKQHRKQQRQRDKGFITLEIIIALIVAFGFLMVSLQAIALGMLVKVGATKEQRADKIIQQEVEQLNDIGSAIALADDPTNPQGIQQACAGNFDGVAGDGYGQALWNFRKGTNYNASPRVIDPNDALVTANDDAITFNETLLGRTLQVTIARNINAGDDTLSPHRVLGLAFQVAEDENGDTNIQANEIIANRYVEVIPDAALECS